MRVHHYTQPYVRVKSPCALTVSNTNKHKQHVHCSVNVACAAVVGSVRRDGVLSSAAFVEVEGGGSGGVVLHKKYTHVKVKTIETCTFKYATERI